MRKCYLCRASMHHLFKFINLAFDVAFGVPNFFSFLFFFLLRWADEGNKENRPCCKGNKNSSRRQFYLKMVSCMVDKKSGFLNPAH